MNMNVVALLLGAALAATSPGSAMAQGTASTAKGAAAPTVVKKVGLDVLKGAWVRPDGGYTIAIRSIAADGRLDATYFNPSPLPFATAQAAQDGATIRVFLELRAAGYGGSTYELAYDPADDRLKGIYHQAVAKQSFEVYFTRKPKP